MTLACVCRKFFWFFRVTVLVFLLCPKKSSPVSHQPKRAAKMQKRIFFFGEEEKFKGSCGPDGTHINVARRSTGLVGCNVRDVFPGAPRASSHSPRLTFPPHTCVFRGRQPVGFFLFRSLFASRNKTKNVSPLPKGELKSTSNHHNCSSAIKTASDTLLSLPPLARALLADGNQR